jgi:uncharacterized damage-inducible protein DinB
MTQTFSLNTLRTYWENYQQRLIATIAPLSSEQLALPAAPHHWTMSELLTHMIGARIWWFHQWMGEENAAIVHWLESSESAVPEAAELATMFEETWRVISPALSRWTAADLNACFHRQPLWQQKGLRTHDSGLFGMSLNMRSTTEASFL